MNKPAEKESPPIALALAFVYEMGRQHEAFQQGIKAELGKQLAKAFDDGFVLGRETGLKDAGFVEGEPAPESNGRPKLN